MKARRWVLAFVAAAMLGGCSLLRRGQDGADALSLDPSRPPAASGPWEWSPPPVAWQRMESGLQVAVLPDGGAPLTHLTLAVGVGVAHDPETSPGLGWVAGRCLPDLVKVGEGSARRAWEGLGGLVEARVETTRTLVTVTLEPERLGEALEVLAAMLPASDMSAPELAACQQRLGAELEARSPDDVLSALFRRRIYGAHPLGRVAPRPVDLPARSAEEVTTHLRAALHPSRVSLALTGAVPASGMEQVGAALSSWRGSALRLDAIPAATPAAVRRLLLVELGHDPLCRLRLGNPTLGRQSPDYMAALVALAGWQEQVAGPLAPLWWDEGGAPPFSARVEVDGPSGLLQVELTSRCADLPASLEHLLAGIDSVRSVPREVAEVAATVQGVSAQRMLAWSDARVAGALLTEALLAGVSPGPSAELEALRGVTPADVLRVSQAVFRPERTLALVAGPDVSGLADPLARFGEVDVIWLE